MKLGRRIPRLVVSAVYNGKSAIENSETVELPNLQRQLVRNVAALYPGLSGQVINKCFVRL